MGSRFDPLQPVQPVFEQSYEEKIFSNLQEKTQNLREFRKKRSYQSYLGTPCGGPDPRVESDYFTIFPPVISLQKVLELH